MDKDEYINVKKTNQRREQEAEGRNEGEIGKPWDKTFTPTMSQAQFSKYPNGPKKGPPEEVLKKHRGS